mgnify:CR=1 FL=1
MLGNLRGKAREYEKSAIRIRKFAALSPQAKLDPFLLAAKLGMKVVTVKDVPGVSDELAKKLLVENAGAWSGASSGELPDGSIIVVLNNTQVPQRCVATLMEEICHVLLGHQPNRLSADLIGARDYNHKNESEAYGVGAAALVPYVQLKQLLEEGLSAHQIARRFGVTESLIEYRCRLTGLAT